jgi:outer membrane immunogenic protein
VKQATYFGKNITMMMKKISYALLGTALLTSVAAQAEEPTSTGSVSVGTSAPACNFSGFYLGLGLGYDSTSGKIEGTSTAAGASTSDNRLSVMKGVNGGVFAGYGKEMGASRVYLGLEASYLLSGEKVNHEDLQVTFSTKKKDTLELAFRLGVAMNNALPYVKVGFANSKFEFSSLAYNAAVPSVFGPFKESKRLNGFLVGTGIDLKVSRNMMMGLGYTYTMYKDQKSKQYSIDGVLAPAASDNVSFQNKKPTSHNVMLRAAYTF